MISQTTRILPPLHCWRGFADKIIGVVERFFRPDEEVEGTALIKCARRTVKVLSAFANQRTQLTKQQSRGRGAPIANQGNATRTRKAGITRMSAWRPSRSNIRKIGNMFFLLSTFAAFRCRSKFNTFFRPTKCAQTTARDAHEAFSLLKRRHCNSPCDA